MRLVRTHTGNANEAAVGSAAGRGSLWSTFPSEKVHPGLLKRVVLREVFDVPVGQADSKRLHDRAGRLACLIVVQLLDDDFGILAGEADATRPAPRSCRIRLNARTSAGCCARVNAVPKQCNSKAHDLRAHSATRIRR